jgi:SulP family sulfate permease
MAGTRHRSNMELVAQGLANLASPIFGGIPATGAIARTATNVKNGGRTPIAGIVHALTLGLVLLAFGRWAALVPLPALAGILLVIAWHMSEWHLLRRLLRSPRSDVVVLLATFTLTVAVDLTVALQVGMVLAALLFMRRMAEISDTASMRAMLRDEDEAPAESRAALGVPDDVALFEVQGALFFGAASKFKDALGRIERPPAVLILRMRKVLAVDATGLRALEDVLDQARRDGTTLVLSGVHAQPLIALERSGLLERIGPDNVCADIRSALERARALLTGSRVPPEPPSPTPA